MQGQGDVDVLVSSTKQGDRATRTRTPKIDNPTLAILKLALFIVLAIVLAGVVVFTYKSVRVLVDAGTRAVDDNVRAKERQRAILALSCGAPPAPQGWTTPQDLFCAQADSATYGGSHSESHLWAAR